MKIQYIKKTERSTFYYKDRAMTILHRIDGPAVQTPEKTLWYRDGLLHREDGPALITKGGLSCFYLDGELYGSPRNYTAAGGSISAVTYTAIKLTPLEKKVIRVLREIQEDADLALRHIDIAVQTSKRCPDVIVHIRTEGGVE
jgi:hypothetical protein